MPIIQKIYITLLILTIVFCVYVVSVYVGVGLMLKYVNFEEVGIKVGAGFVSGVASSDQASLVNAAFKLVRKNPSTPLSLVKLVKDAVR